MSIRTVIAGLAAGAVAIGGIAWATAAAPSTVIKGCYQKNNGQLRIVDSLDQCSSSEVGIQWNQAGAQGATGPRGVQGPTGPRGQQGPTGARGQQGPTGSQGIQGVPGQNGSRGPTGTTGAGGTMGPPGPPGPTGAAGTEPVTPPDQWQFFDGPTNSLQTTFSLQFTERPNQTVRVTSFAGCTPSAFGALPSSCYFTIRGLTDSLEQWLNDTLEGNSHAVQDLIVRGPLSSGAGGTPEVQFRLDDAFITSASVNDLDVSAQGNGSVSLIVAANGFEKEAPTSPPSCECNSSLVFDVGQFSLTVGFTNRIVVALSGLGFTVPRLGTANYTPGTPQFTSIRVGVGVSNSANSTRTYFQAWSDNVANGGTDLRDGRVTLRTGSGSLTDEIDLTDLEPVMPFEPLFIGGRQTFTLRPGAIDYH